ncbi:hypothetical protein [Desulfothermus sp.]
MARKNIQIVSVLLIGIVAGFLGGYLFKQSSKLKQVNRSLVTAQQNSSSNAKKEFSVEEKGKIFKKDLLKELAKKGNQNVGKGEGERVKKEVSKSESSFKRWINEYVITPYFIDDLVEFILNSYQPPSTQDNPTNQPKLNISLRALNARYGLELIGLKVDAPSLEKARKKILEKIMDPDLLKAQYERFIDIFINELIDNAKETTKVFREHGKTLERELNKDQIKTLLILLSNYVQDLSNVLTTISTERSLLTNLENYLKEEARSTHYNFVLNQIINNYNLAKQKLTVKQGDSASREKKVLAELEKKKNKALKDYELSIKRRERLRTEIISFIEKKNPKLSFNSSEILYICEWVHRRIKEGQSLEKIKQIALILELAADKMRQKAEELSL